MKKLSVFLALVLIVISFISHGMEEQSSAAKKIILLNIGTNATSLKEATQSINVFVHVNKEFNIIINDPAFCLQLIKHLAKKFHCSDEEAARALKTRTAKQRLKLQKQLFKTVAEMKPEITSDLEALRKKGADLNFIYQQKDRSKTLLMMAVIDNNCPLIEALINNGADSNTADVEGITALMWAVIKGHLDAAKRLLNNVDIKINQQTNRGKTALIWAAMGNNCSMIDLLIKHGADINQADFAGETPLLWAVGERHPKAVQCLLNNPHIIMIEQQNNVGDTALMFAIAIRNEEIIHQLIDAGADLKSPNKNGVTPLQKAEQTGSTKIFLLIDLAIKNKSFKVEKSKKTAKAA